MKKQFGRSMIEMLGVLAIIGVLSIGGIMMYRRAVNNHHANVILDDANRLAFVITEKGSFPVNDNIVGIEFNQTSTYSLVPFVGQKSGQYGIMVENVPKGVCEPLVDKASVEYKVRVMPYNSTEYIDQIANTGTVYDSFHKDICINDMNDVILYFGDTSGQCNKPEEGEDYTKCNTNADCCGTHFCAFETVEDCRIKGEGTCRLISDYGTGTGNDAKTVNGQNFIRSSSGMTWYSAESWCSALGKKLAAAKDLGCGDFVEDHTKGYCTDTKESGRPGRTGSILALLQSSPSPAWTSGYYWLTDRYTACSAFYSIFNYSSIGHIGRDGSSIALCK